MSRQRYVVEFGDRVVGIAFRVRGGFLFMASDSRFQSLDRQMFPRARALARRLGEMCDETRLTIRGDECRRDFETGDAAIGGALGPSPFPEAEVRS